MEKRKINMLSLILIILVTLLVGIGIGYVIFSNVSKVIKSKNEGQQGFTETSIKNTIGQETTVENTLGTTVTNTVKNTVENTLISMVENNVVTNTASSTNSNVTAIPKYDVEKSIIVNGKIFKVSCNNKLHKDAEDMKDYKTTLFMNDEEITTVNTMTYENDGYTSIWDRKSEIELSTINDKLNPKIKYIVVIVNSDTPSGEVKNIYVINQERNILGEIYWTDASGIVFESKNEKEYVNLETYGLLDDKIVIYNTDYNSGNEKLIKTIYFINNGQIQKETQSCVVDRVVGAGK